jgi:hypothetical protein
MHNISIMSVFFFIETGWNVTVPVLHRVKKYPWDYGTNNYNPIWLGIKSEVIQTTEGFCAYLKK